MQNQDIHHCWKCKEYFEIQKGKVSQKGYFTCFPCLKQYTKDMNEIRKVEIAEMKKQELKEPINQLNFFEIHDTINSVFT